MSSLLQLLSPEVHSVMCLRARFFVIWHLLKTALVNYQLLTSLCVLNFSNIDGKFGWLISVRFSDDDALVSSYQLVARDSSRGKRSIKCCYFYLLIISTYSCCLKKLGFWVKLCVLVFVLSSLCFFLCFCLPISLTGTRRRISQSPKNAHQKDLTHCHHHLS